jgi:hypothetical protein
MSETREQDYSTLEHSSEEVVKVAEFMNVPVNDIPIIREAMSHGIVIGAGSGQVEFERVPEEEL